MCFIMLIKYLGYRKYAWAISWTVADMVTIDMTLHQQIAEGLFHRNETFFLISGKKLTFFFIGPHKQVFRLSVCYLVLENYFQNKNGCFFLSGHEWAHDLYQNCHKRDPNVSTKCHKRFQSKYCIKRNPDDGISFQVGLYEIVNNYVLHHLRIT